MTLSLYQLGHSHQTCFRDSENGDYFRLLVARAYSPLVKLSAHTVTEVWAKALWWMIHSESVSMLSCDADSLLSFSCRVATEKEDMTFLTSAWPDFPLHLRACVAFFRVATWGMK